MMAEVTSSLAAHLASGCLFLASVLSLRHRLPPGFLRFCTLGSAILAILAALLSSASELRLLWVFLAAAAGLWYVHLRRKGAGAGPLPAGLGGLAALGTTALAAAFAAETGPWLAVVSHLSAAILLGAVAVSMVLGHWYLVDTGLSIAPLRLGALWLSLAVILRWVAVGSVLMAGGWEVLGIGRAADIIYSTTGLFFLFRSLMGLGAPLLLAGLVWQTVKIRSTQSATGLLYVALVLVLFGELISSFLHVATGHPL